MGAAVVVVHVPHISLYRVQQRERKKTSPESNMKEELDAYRTQMESIFIRNSVP